jgi:hypothetical protein
MTILDIKYLPDVVRSRHWANTGFSRRLLQIVIHASLTYIVARFVRLIMRCNIEAFLACLDDNRAALTRTCCCCDTILSKLTSNMKEVGCHGVLRDMNPCFLYLVCILTLINKFPWIQCRADYGCDTPSLSQVT